MRQLWLRAVAPAITTASASASPARSKTPVLMCSPNRNTPSRGASSVANEPQAHPSLAAAGRPVTLVDSSVVLDIVTEDPAWAEWSAEALARARDGLLVINPIVYAEIGEVRAWPADRL